MGALNITPDSFSDGGLFFDESKAYDQADLMIKSGATIIDATSLLKFSISLTGQ